jgi:hypothetical protein
MIRPTNWNGILIAVNRGVSVSIFCRAALLEVLDGAINSNPIMFRLLKNRSDGGGSASAPSATPISEGWLSALQ